MPNDRQRLTLALSKLKPQTGFGLHPQKAIGIPCGYGEKGFSDFLRRNDTRTSVQSVLSAPSDSPRGNAQDNQSSDETSATRCICALMEQTRKHFRHWLFQTIAASQLAWILPMNPQLFTWNETE